MKIARTLTFSLISAGVIGGAAVGLTGTAGATTVADNVRPPHVVATPDVTARPAPQVIPGAHWHRGVYRQQILQPDDPA